jgi:hypothetical protein
LRRGHGDFALLLDERFRALLSVDPEGLGAAAAARIRAGFLLRTAPIKVDRDQGLQPLFSRARSVWRPPPIRAILKKSKKICANRFFFDISTVIQYQADASPYLLW